LADRFNNYSELSCAYTKGEDYKIKIEGDRSKSILIIAPHGGKIEPYTSLIAKKLAGDKYCLYCFEGNLKKDNKENLHITSHHFDEPEALALVGKCDTTIGIHGRADNEDEETIFLGGLDCSFVKAIAEKLDKAGFKSKTKGHHFLAKKSTNICNRGTRGKGVQLEIPRTLRNKFNDSSDLLDKFVTAIHQAIERHDPNKNT